MATGTATALTLEEFAALPNEGVRHELDRGELITMAPPQFPHSDVASNVLIPLGYHVRRLGLGNVMAEAGFLLSDEPATVRQPDIAFLSADQLSRKPSKGYFRGAPTIAIEVVSPSETAADLETKIRQYLAAGCQAVAAVYPRSRTIMVYRPGVDPHCLEGDGVLSFPDVLGDWSLPLAEIFPSQT